MSTDTQTDDGREYTAIELSRMSATEAHEQLDDEQFERWAAYAELKDKQQREEQAREDAARDVIDVAVSAHLDELHEEMDAYGDTVTYHFDIDESTLAVEEQVREHVPGDAAGDVADLADIGPDALQGIKHAIAELFATTWIRFENGETGETVDYREHDDDAVRRHIRGVVNAWGVRPSYRKMHEMMNTIHEHDREVVEQADKFPAGSGGGAGGDTPAQWARDHRRANKRNTQE